MRKRARPIVVIAAATLSVGSLFACSQILGVEDIPSAGPDAGVDATKHVDAARDARPDGHDTGVDAGLCVQGATRCSSDGLGVETCGADGGFGAAVACSGATPVCLGGACTCEPGATQCVGQTFQRCVVPDGAAPRWPDGGATCPGTCTLTGCGTTPPSCNVLDAGIDGTSAPDGAGVTNCLASDASAQSCCTSNEAPGGAFYLSYDGYALDAGSFVSPSHRAIVSSFRLDRFEVTVGRFRRFVAVLGNDGGGWAPAPGAGKHAHLNGGLGLVDRASDGGATYEPGWDAAWDMDLATSTTPSALVHDCPNGYRSWTPVAGPNGNENLPMNCLTWVQAYAFCIWDGGFLPSEAEWNYAAAGGDQQRIYPWSPSLAQQATLGDAGPNAAIDCDRSKYEACGPDRTDTVGIRPKGDSRWSQADMAGNVSEWTLDAFEPYASTCTDCAALGTPVDGGLRVRRGGAFVSLPGDVFSAYRGYDRENDGAYTGGVRCARTP
jgi:sulfatase modifying factor 1